MPLCKLELRSSGLFSNDSRITWKVSSLYKKVSAIKWEKGKKLTLAFFGHAMFILHIGTAHDNKDCIITMLGVAGIRSVH